MPDTLQLSALGGPHYMQALAKIVALEAERDALKFRLTNANSDRVLVCEWCGKSIKYGDDTLKAIKDMEAHSLACAKNPLVARVASYEAELTAAAQELQDCPPVGRPEPCGPLDVVAGLRGVLSENRRLWQCLDILRTALKVPHGPTCPAVDSDPNHPLRCTCGADRIAAALRGEIAADRLGGQGA